MKVLYYGETPIIQTGGGQVGKHLLEMLAEKGHDVRCVPINHPDTAKYNKEKYPYIFYPSPSGQMHNVENARRHILEDEYDLLFLTGDINIIDSVMDAVIERRQSHSFRLAVYAAIDNFWFNRHYLRCLTLADYPVVFSAYARGIAVFYSNILAGRIYVIGHGCEPDVFYPLPEDERREVRKNAFGCGDDDFIVINVNRNQVRKDLGRSMYAFHKFHQKRPNSKLYLHAKRHDVGGHLPSQAALLGLTVLGSEPSIIFTPPDYEEVNGIPRHMLNRIYNAADVFFTTSTGEGWGLTTTEAMAAQVPIVAPANTTFVEILGSERGYLAESGGDDLWFIQYGESEAPRELVSVTDSVRQLEYVYTHRNEAKEKARKAREWTLLRTWKHIKHQWQVILDL